MNISTERDPTDRQVSEIPIYAFVDMHGRILKIYHDDPFFAYGDDLL